MKLEYEYSMNNTKKNICMCWFLILLGISTFVLAVYVVGGKEIIKGESFLEFNILIFIFISIIGVFITLGLLYFNKLKNRENEEIVGNGIIKKGYIFLVIKELYYSRRSYNHKLLIKDENDDCYEISNLCNNKAYRLLEKYFKINGRDVCFRYSDLPKISIDVYIYNNKVYADLDSVDLSIIEKD